jgi:cell division protein FtsB
MKSAAISMVDRGGYSTISSDYKRKSPRKAGFGSIDFRVFFVAIMFFSLIAAGAWSAYRVIAMEQDIHMLKKRSDSLAMEQIDLNREKQSMLTREHLEMLGGKMGLHAPDKKQVVFLKQGRR